MRQSSKENPEHQLSAEVSEALNARHKAARELLDLQNEIGRATEINEEYANAQRDVYRAVFEPLKIDAGKTADRLNEAKQVYNAKVRVSLMRLIDIKRQRFTPKLSDIYSKLLS